MESNALQYEQGLIGCFLIQEVLFIANVKALSPVAVGQ